MKGALPDPELQLKILQGCGESDRQHRVCTVMLEEGVEICCGGLRYKIVEAHPIERRWGVSPFCFDCPDNAEAADEVVVRGS